MSPAVIAIRPSEAGRLVLRRDAGGNRHYLDGHPVPCGTALELAAVRYRYDRATDTEHLDPTGEWLSVRYEAELYRDPPVVRLYAEVGGHRAEIRHYAGMRLRWPEGGR